MSKRPKKYTHICLYCGEKFKGAYRINRFCNPACYKKYHYNNNEGLDYNRPINNSVPSPNHWADTFQSIGDMSLLEPDDYVLKFHKGGSSKRTMTIIRIFY